MRLTRLTAGAILSIVLVTACGSPAVWEGPDGAVTEETGSSHCDEEGVTFVRVNDNRFASDPQNALFDQGALDAAFDGDAILPASATDTSLRDGDWHMWLASDASAVFVVEGDTVEKWPRVDENYGCD